MGRPRKKLDENVIMSLGERGWNDEQIAAACKCDPETIRRRFAAKLIIARKHGAAKLLDILWQRGVTGKSDKVLLHLADRIIGKVVDKVEMTGKDGTPMESSQTIVILPDNDRQKLR